MDSSTEQTPEAGSDADAGPADIKASLVHAAPGIGSIRFCVAINGLFALPDQIPPQSAVPGGVPFGAGGDLGVDPATAQALPGSALTMIVFAASVDPSGMKSCAMLIPDPTNLTTGFFATPTLPVGTFAHGKSYFLVLLGCPAGVDASDGQCGPAVPAVPSGNLRFVVIEADTKTMPAPNAIGAQFIQLSPALTAAVGPVIAGFDYTSSQDAGADAGAEAGTATTIVQLGNQVGFDSNPVPTPSSAVVSSDVAAHISSANFNLYTPAADGGIGAAAFASVGLPDGLALSQVAYATLGTADAGAGYFQPGVTYSFMAIGDPAVAAAPGNTGLRVIALPNAP